MGVPRIVPISDLRADAAALVKETRETRNPVFITQRGRATAVLMSIEEYNAEAERQQMLDALDEGLAEIRAGARGHSIDEVIAQLNDIVERDA